MSRRYFIIWSSLILGGCSIVGGPGAPEQLQVDIKNVQTSTISPASRRASASMHAFLVGQLAYDEERNREALESFVRARDSIDGPAPLLDTRLAELYLAAGQLEEALEVVNRALVAEPERAEFLLFKAGLLDALGRHHETPPLYQRARTSAPGRLDAAVLLASSHIERGEVEAAAEILENLTKVNPSDSLGWYYLARSYERQHRLPQALRAYEEARKRDPQNFTMTLDVVRVLINLKRMKEARESLSQLLKKDPQNTVLVQLVGELEQGEAKAKHVAEQLSILTSLSDTPMDVRYRMALIHIERRHFRDAQRELRIVLAGQPGNAQARYYLASLFAGGGRKSEAISELYKIGPGEDLYVKSRTFAAFILRQEGNLAEAEKAVRDALAVEPNNRNILSYLILILRDGKKYEEAEQLMRQSVEADPENDRLLFNYAILLHDMQRETESHTVMERVLRLNPKNSDALNFVAYGLAEKGGDLNRALELIHRALAERPNDGYYLDTLGWVHYQRGEYKDAEEVLSRAASAVSEDIVIQEHYADALVRLGKFEKAAEVYRNALERGRDKAQENEEEVLARIEKKLQALDTGR